MENHTPTPKKPKEEKPKTPPPPPVPMSRDEALEKLSPVGVARLVELVKKFKMLEGDVHFVKVWPYYNAESMIDIFDIRFENETGKKAVITFYWDGNKFRSTGAPVLLFNRDKLIQDPQSPVLIVEGAKSADEAKKIPGFVPVTWNGGGKKCKQVDWTPLKDRTVYIYPDDDQKHYPPDHRYRPGQLKPENEQPGIATAFDIKAILPHARIIRPLPKAREIKPDGADIVEALEVMEPLELAEYIKNAPEIKPPVADHGHSNPIDTPSNSPEINIFPFEVLGIADDGKGYYLDRHERMISFSLGSITQNKLLLLAPLTWWSQEYATGKGGKMDKDDWAMATDALIHITGRKDFDSERIRGRGAWRERDGRVCYHDGLHTIGDADSSRIYLRVTQKDIGLSSPYPSDDVIAEIRTIVGQLSFETQADMIRCISWSTLAPFAGALPWRPAGLLTGRSESGKSTIVDMIVKPLALPMVFSGGESTEAGVRQKVNNDAVAIVIEEAETDTIKKRQRRDDILSLMRQSTSDETPKAAKGTIDGKGMMFTLRSMFMFVAISPEVSSIADDNRLFRINLEKNDNDWAMLKRKLGETLTPNVCAGIRAMTWARLKAIFELADRMQPIIQTVTYKSSRFATAESLLFATYHTIWKRYEAPLTNDELHDFFTQIYKWQPLEESRDETTELLNRLLDEIIQDGKDKRTLREILQVISGKGHGDPNYFKSLAGRYGLGLTPDGDLAIAKNHYMIQKIIERGAGYQRIFARHNLLKEKAHSVSIGGKVRNCLVIDKQILTESSEEVF